MRIECAKCGEVHDSASTPFTHDIIKSEKVDPKYNAHEMLSKRFTSSKFTCTVCGLINHIKIVWHTVGK